MILPLLSKPHQGMPRELDPLREWRFAASTLPETHTRNGDCEQ